MIRRYLGGLVGSLVGWYGYGLVVHMSDPWWAGLIACPLLAGVTVGVLALRERREVVKGIDRQFPAPRRW